MKVQQRLCTRTAVLLCVTALVLLADRCSKLWALSALSDGRSVRLPLGLGLTLVRNPGASLGMGSSSTWLISCLAIVACVVLALLALRTRHMVWTVALSLGCAGAFGNLIDRVIYADGFLNGRVVDFIDYGWSVGNVADIVLLVAAVMAVVLIMVGVPFGAADHTDHTERTIDPESAGQGDRS